MATDNPTFLRAHPADWLRIAIPIVLLTITYSADLFLLELAMLLQLGLAVLWLLVNVFSVIDQKKRPAWAYVPATLDLVTTTLLVYATGATSSPFAFLYVVYAAISSLNLEARQGLFSTVLAIACYGSTSTLTYMGVLNPINIIGEFATLGLAGVLTSCLVFAMVIGLTHYIISDLIRNNYEARRKLELASKQMNADLDMARKIQMGLIPTRALSAGDVTVQSRYIALQAVGGDYLDYFTDRDGNLGILVADAAGHGIPAALIASMTKVAADRLRSQMRHPARMMGLLNRSLLNKTNNNFVAATYAVYHPAKNILRYSMAGNPPPYLLRPGKPALRLDGNGPVLGVLENATYHVQELQLSPGDRIVFFTDGINECRSDAGVELDEEQLTNLLTGVTALQPTQDAAVQIVDDLTRFTGTRGFEDDITLVVLSVAPVLSPRNATPPPADAEDLPPAP